MAQQAPDPRPSYLLLLTPAPWPATPETLRDVYEGPLTAVLEQLAEERRRASVGACIDVAVPIPLLAVQGDQPRSQIYSAVQTIVASIYKRVCVIAAKREINVEDAAGFDVRVILLAGPQLPDQSRYRDSLLGSVISLPTLARSGRSWTCVFSVEHPAGEALLHEYLRSQDGRVKIRRVRGHAVEETDPEAVDVDSGAPRHSKVIVGGTWDHLHIGHKLLLTMSAFLAEPDENGHASLTVGITGDEALTKKKYAEMLESWQDRQEGVVRFLRAILDFRHADKAQIDMRLYEPPILDAYAIHYQLGEEMILKMSEIADVYGPTTKDEALTALVLSAETRAGGKAVNDQRKEQTWHELEVFEVDVLDTKEASASGQEAAQSFEAKLSSTDIRRKLSEHSKAQTRTV